MRIRKNAKLSPLLFSSCLQGGSVPVETHVCQLNQSPWDVIPFDSDSIQFQPDDSFTAGNNGSAGDSFGAVESSVASMMDADKTEHTTTRTIMADNNSKVAPNNGATSLASPCLGFDGKGWPCKNEAKQGQSFCEQHLSLSLPASYNNKKSQAQAQARRAKTRGAGKKAAAGASSNPYEFYYYSGFGPLWGKRRGDRNGEGSRNGVNSTMVGSDNAVAGTDDVVDDDINDSVVPSGVAVVPSVSEMDNEGIIDYEDDDEEEVDDDSGKKRMRKPVKARSLKSLM
ncbi:hypothetical protein E2542_SST13832 [Spatholobus suberectus]|nr:hypothetical protein E2542_SST13831 [Spatholobus suberectus]TKY63948.1 hypothetical protein E2542_SST13832 [Spatholobus suberectus]